MPRERRLWQFRLNDILEAIGRIEGYVAGMTFEQFAADRKTLDAVERNFIAIGEAARGVPDEIEVRYPDVPWGDVLGSGPPASVARTSPRLFLSFRKCCGGSSQKRSDGSADG
jgi:hypothetical protein